jgi:uncharacterized protein YaiI (UPF0178 family)
MITYDNKNINVRFTQREITTKLRQKAYIKST